jgi:uncharacterized protein
MRLMTPSAPLPTCWVVTDGKPGMENQCRGLAESMGLQPVIKRIALRTPWRQLSPWLQLGLSSAFSKKGDAITPPWPDILIGTGRQSVPASLLAKRASGGRTTTIQIQDCALPPKNFDLVIVPQHDKLRGDNVLVARGALHRVTAEKLAGEAAKFAPLAAGFPRPLVAVLLGGNNGVYHFTPDVARRLAADLLKLQKDQGIGLLITPSRRTGEEATAILKEALTGSATVFWDGTGDNPYFGFLGLADAVIVTCDSVSMVSEACSTGKPVHILDLPGGSDKFAKFHEGLRRDGVTRPFAGKIDFWSYDPLDDMGHAVAASWDAVHKNKARLATDASPATDTKGLSA